MKKRVYHVISNTHWDREWRYPFQRNRQMLVDMVDKVLEILEKEPQYRAFHLDSQSIVLKDYLEIRPHKKDIIRKYVEENRLLIGPWYILPEEYQVGGENLIRNLLLGHKICNQNGGVSKIGYSPFSWGQITQLPQIYKEFGIELIMFYRGVNALESPKAEFLWEGADGTKAITSRFSTMPRYNFYFYIYRPVIHNEGLFDVEYKWSNGGNPFHFADKQLSMEDYFITEPVDGYYPENIEPQVNAIIEKQVNDFTTEHVIWMEGHDSSGPNIKTVNIINDIKKMMPDVDVRHSTLEEYAKAVFKSVDVKKLKLVKGERRSSKFDARSGDLYGYTTSARMYLKQKNFEAEKWLQFYAEPFNIFSGILGRDINDKYPETAWELLVQNSAHDSIGGCSLDEIHEDMMNRYKHSIEISKGTYERALKYISTRLDTSSFIKKNEKDVNDKIFLSVFNTNNYFRSEVTEAFIDIPKEFDQGSFRIVDENGKELPFTLLKRKDHQPVLEQMIDRPMYFDMVNYQILFEPKNVPPFGYKTYRIVPAKNQKAKEKSLLKSTSKTVSLENEFLKIKINNNGSLDITDKQSKHTYKNQAYFYDEGEAGHAWVNKPTAPFADTLESKPVIEIMEDNASRCTVKIQHVIDIPVNLQERSKKKPKMTAVPVALSVTLTKKSKYAEFNVELDNTAESHRIRLMFPTKLKADYSWGEGQFDVVKRSLERPDTSDWIEQPMYDFPMHQFVDLSDDKKGCAILVDGLKEYEVLDDKNKTLAITLIRAFEYIIAPSSRQDYTYQKGSQCLGLNKFRLAFYPHKGDYQKGNVYEEALNFNHQLTLIQTGSCNGNLPASASFMEIEPKELVFSTLKKPEDEKTGSCILRIYNPTDKKIKGNIKFLANIKKAEEITLEETKLSDMKIQKKNSVKISLDKKKIKTYRIYY